MKVLKKTDDYTVYQKRSGRYAVIGADNSPINGDTFSFLGIGEFPGNNIQQQYLHTYIGKMTGNTTTHDPGSYNRNFFYSSF